MKTIYTNLKVWGTALFAAGALVMSTTTSNAQTAYGPFSDAPALTITDDAYDGTLGSMVSSGVAVSGVTGTYVVDITVDVSINHTWPGDLVLKLESPDGDILTLMSRPGLAETADDGTGCCGESFDWTGEVLTFADWGEGDAELLLSGDGLASDSVRFPNPGITAYPTQDFASLMGGTMNGTWTLYVGDGVGGDEGTFNSWSITITTASPSFTLEKTVGLEPDPTGNGCLALPVPTTNVIGVNAGDSVCYWYTVTNTGDIDLDLIDFADDQLFPGGFTNTPGFDLTVGSSLSIPWDDIPTEITAEVTNIVNITYHNSEFGISATEQIDNATVGIIPDNDLCAGAEPISCGQTVTGTTTYASNDATMSFCGTSLTSAPGVWYSFFGTGNEVTLTTCNAGTAYDTKLGVFEGSCGALVCVAGNDDQSGGTVPECVVPETGSTSNRASTVTFVSGYGVQYFVYVTGFLSNAGDYELTLSCAAPDNDNVCDAASLSFGSNGPVYTTTATVETGEPVPGAGTGSNNCESQDGWCGGDLVVDNSVWYTFVAPASGNVTLNTDGSYDTQVAVYSAASCADVLSGGATLVGANDDNPDYITTIFSSELTLPCLTPGETYYVQVDGFAGDAGPLYIEFTDNGGVAVSATVSGGGLSCDGANVLVQADFTGVGPWDIIIDVDGNQFPQMGLTTPSVLPVNTAGTYSIVSVTDQGTGCSTAGTGSAVVTVGTSPVADYSAAQSAGSLDVDFTDASTGSAPLTYAWDFGDGNTSSAVSPSHTYAAAGEYEVCLIVSNDCDPDGDTSCTTITVVPENDLCGDAIAIACGGSATGSTEFATSDASAVDCNSGRIGVWYVFTGTGDNLAVSTSNAGTDYDTYLGISESCGGPCVAANDDDPNGGLTSLIEDFPTVLGQDYYIFVSGFSTEVGNYELTVTCTTPPPPPANDNVCDAIGLSMGANGPYDVSNATAESGEPVPPAGTGSSTCESQDGWCSFELAIQNSVWFTFVAPASGTITVNTDDSYDTQIAIYEATSCQDVTTGGATLLGANDDNPDAIITSFSSELTVCGLTPGSMYYLQVDGYNGDEGSLNIDLSEPLVADWSSSATNLDVDFTDASSAAGSIVSWDWDFGDGNVSTDQNPSHSYAAANTYTVCLTVTDDAGCSTTYCEDVTVTDIPTSIAEAVENGMEVFPNPSNGEFVVAIRGVEADVQIIVMDVTGRQVYNEGVALSGNFRKDVNLGSVAKGSYILQIATTEGVVNRKIQVH